MIVKDKYIITVRKGGFVFIHKAFETSAEAEKHYQKVIKSYPIDGLFVREAVIKLWKCQKATKVKKK